MLAINYIYSFIFDLYRYNIAFLIYPNKFCPYDLNKSKL